MDCGRVGIDLDFATQVANMAPQKVAFSFITGAPHGFDKLLVSKYLASMVN